MNYFPGLVLGIGIHCYFFTHFVPYDLCCEYYDSQDFWWHFSCVMKIYLLVYVVTM